MSIESEISVFHEQKADLLKRAAETVGLDPDVFVDKAIPQSELFMAEVIRVLHDLYLPAPTNALKYVLDVGPQSFGGTALLERLHRPTSFNKLKLEVSALDITNKFELLRMLQCPNVKFILSDIFADIPERWDTIICSHVIEHVPDPQLFLRRLQELSHDFVIVACPWEEFPLATNGHINTIDEDFVRSVGGNDTRVFVNYNWGKNRKVCMFWLPGRATRLGSRANTRGA